MYYQILVLFQFGLGSLFPHQELRPYEALYRCYSIAMCPELASTEKTREMENGGKTRLHIEYPMMFKLTNCDKERRRFTHSGVLEFHQEEGKCYIPYWMMRNLLLSEGELIKVEYSNLPVATYVKFKPQSMEFLDITNPRAVLELKLRSFACLTKGDIIAIEYNNKVSRARVLLLRLFHWNPPAVTYYFVSPSRVLFLSHWNKRLCLLEALFSALFYL
ncbi:unnamed protein product, partial [Soboliphyme baturini]|uniref:Ubiquitin fusion degradation protein 1-like protein n=1 Tax=Soboliphyme baturini TaxID=241478 RepID=A0A183JAN6_9BILA